MDIKEMGFPICIRQDNEDLGGSFALIVVTGICVIMMLAGIVGIYFFK